MDDSLQRLLGIMARLRDPEKGCAWDIKQTFETIAPYTIEEAYEVADAILRRDIPDLKEELGDLLLQVVFHAQIAKEARHFDFNAVAAALCDKLETRHPHIFANGVALSDEDVQKIWQEKKAQEKAAKNSGREQTALDGIPSNMPALLQAVKILDKAAETGFKWPDYRGALAKLKEEMAELEAELNKPDTEKDSQKISDEIGDLLFILCNLSGYFKLSPELVLLQSLQKFRARFRLMQKELVNQPGGASLEDMEKAWAKVKNLAPKK